MQNIFINPPDLEYVCQRGYRLAVQDRLSKVIESYKKII